MSELRKMPVKTRQIELDGDFAGWEFTARTNPSIAVLEKLQSGKFGMICEALGETVLAWNFVDEEGEALPSPAELWHKAREEFRGNLNKGETPNRDRERILCVRAAAEVVSRLSYDLTLAISNSLSEAVSSPEKN